MRGPKLTMLFAASALGLRLGHLSPRAPATLRVRMQAAAPEPDGFEEAFVAARAMKVSELKAELELRGIEYEHMFEKAELAKALAKVRVEGRASPEIIDKFNRQNMERMMEDNPAPLEDLTATAATAGDGSLPGGMSPDKLAALMSNPEMMALIQNPKMQELMKVVMEKGAGGVDASMLEDAEMRELLEKLKGVLG